MMLMNRKQPVAPVRGRYAPSPSGELHLGNLRTALLAWLFARHAGDAFVLRVEDLDRPRMRPGATERMLTDLRWLGLDWDEGPDIGGPYAPYLQSERIAIYEAYLRRLVDTGLVYPCYCSRADVLRAASAPHGPQSEGPRYPGTCRTLTRQQRQERERQGRPPSLRFCAPAAPISFTDLLAGPQSQRVSAEVGDFIVRRADGIFAYQFAVVVDDALMGITQVVRGADLLHSTARQIALFQALGFSPPRYAHVPLLVDATGQRLAKRAASLGLEPLRAQRFTPEQVVGLLASSAGLCPAGTALHPRDLLARFDPQRLSRMPFVLRTPDAVLRLASQGEE
jgi:glutamyl-tRNA synthetase